MRTDPTPRSLSGMSNADLHAFLALYAYDSGTRENTMNFLCFQVADLLDAVRRLDTASSAARA